MIKDLFTNLREKIDNKATPHSRRRYERKFVVSDLQYEQVLSIIKHHPAFFKEIFKQRKINNIYLDTHDLRTYFDNVYGNTHRVKVRIRWYGDTFGPVEKPVLELKIKDGLAGKKRSYALNPFTIDRDFTRLSLSQAFDHPRLPEWVKEKLASYTPSLLNSYKRQYFLSRNRKIRVTLDKEMTYYAVSARNNTFAKKYIENQKVIVEMKYSLEEADTASQITQHFPMRMTKSSKYVNGIEIFNPQLAI
jgi:SPX domain protein involved in polyphosphate accumulation